MGVDKSIGFNQTEYRGAYLTCPPTLSTTCLSPSSPKKAIPWSRTEYQDSYLTHREENATTSLATPRRSGCGPPMPPLPTFFHASMPTACGSEAAVAAPKWQANRYSQAPLLAEPHFFTDCGPRLGV